MRIRAFPFSDDVFAFIRDHEQVFVVEQNRDGQLKSLLVNEGGVHPARLVSVLHYDGSPISARFIIKDITEKLKAGQATLRENAE
jgi:2-oxoglutarate ferredoxin oxidoreductase subunit alpha